MMKYTTTTPHWYLVLDGLTLTFSAIGVVISSLFLLIVIVCRRQRRRITNLISCNTQLAISSLSGVTLFSIANALNNDLQFVEVF